MIILLSPTKSILYVVLTGNIKPSFVPKLYNLLFIETKLDVIVLSPSSFRGNCLRVLPFFNERNVSIPSSVTTKPSSLYSSCPVAKNGNVLSSVFPTEYEESSGDCLNIKVLANLDFTLWKRGTVSIPINTRIARMLNITAIPPVVTMLVAIKSATFLLLSPEEACCGSFFFSLVSAVIE